MQILYLFEKIRNPILDFFFSTVTYLGDEIALMLIAIVLFWCIDKRKGYFMLVSGFFGILVNQTMKLICKIPRPWLRDPSFTIVESAREAATGYSFPSGHTQNAVTIFGSIFITSKKRPIKIIAIVAAVLVPISRMYLGVHTFWDVVAATGCAIIILLLLDEVFSSEERLAKYMPFISALLILGAVAFLVYAYVFNKNVNDVNVLSARKNALTMIGCSIGIVLVYFLDRHVIKFETAASWYCQIIKVVVGFGIILVIKSLLKTPLLAIMGESERAVRYFLMIAFGGAGWPALFVHINKIKIKALDNFGEKVASLMKRNKTSKAK